MASPFESQREPASVDAADRARADLRKIASEVTPLAATAEINHGLDSTTRESLSRLAQLIRKQIETVQASEPEAIEPTKEEAAHQGKHDQDEEQQRKREDDMKQLAVSGKSEVPPLNTTNAESFPNVLRLERHFERASRERGSKIYRQQKAKDAVQMILSELESRNPTTDLDNVDELLIDVAEAVALNKAA